MQMAITLLHALYHNLSTYRSSNIHIHTSRQAGLYCVNVSIPTGLPEVQALETGDWNVLMDIHDVIRVIVYRYCATNTIHHKLETNCDYI